MSAVAPRTSVSFDELTLHYQPQMSADGSQVVGAEALLRVVKPTPRFMSPADVLAFFHAPEDEEALDWWVLRRACTDALRWPSLTVGINVSAARFRDRKFANRLMKLIGEIGVDPRQIELEIVEGAYISDFDAALANITTLRGKGVKIAIDDFGTGYSSLTYLLKMPVDKIKIDKSFVRELVRDDGDAAIVRSIIGLGQSFGKRVLAEGIESAAQFRFLLAEGCHEGQGYHFARPMPESACTDLLRRLQPAVAERALPALLAS